MTQQRGAHEKRADAGDDGDRSTRRRRKTKRPTRRAQRARIVISALVTAVGLASLLMVSISSFPDITHERSQGQVATSQLSDSLFACLEGQIRHAVPAGTEVWVNPDAPEVNAGPSLPSVPDPLRVVAAMWATLTPVRSGHINLDLVHAGGKSTCLGLSIEIAPAEAASDPISEQTSEPTSGEELDGNSQADPRSVAQRNPRPSLQMEVH
ncbi:MAG: hypothetical protein ACLP6E_01685 [Acidimicrobiales bacterium]